VCITYTDDRVVILKTQTVVSDPEEFRFVDVVIRLFTIVSHMCAWIKGWQVSKAVKNWAVDLQHGTGVGGGSSHRPPSQVRFFYNWRPHIYSILYNIVFTAVNFAPLQVKNKALEVVLNVHLFLGSVSMAANNSNIWW
jgi:hypothetical protein